MFSERFQTLKAYLPPEQGKQPVLMFPKEDNNTGNHQSDGPQ